mgnify:CR=1 FL=1
MGLCFLLEVVYNKIAVSIPTGCELCTARRNKHLEYLEAVSVSIAHRPKRSFYPHTALLSLAIHQGLLRKIALSAGKNPRRSAHPAYENSFSPLGACGERACDKEIIKLEKFVITGGKPLHGEVIISGAKNAAVGILPATILAADVCVIENLPDISDVAVSLKILSVLGAKVRMLNKNTYEIDTTHLTGTNVPDDLSRQMRASYYFLGALLSRFGKAQVAMPGGCNLGPRPIDQHLKVFSALGADDSVDYGMITVHAEELNGAHIFFDKVSVGATMNGMLSAVMAKGQTILENCAKEPHVVDLANFLNMCGADVRGAGTDVIKVRGVERMHGCTYSIIPDQIEAGSYMVAAAATAGDVLVLSLIHI